jgi:hypothetical protein
MLRQLLSRSHMEKNIPTVKVASLGGEESMFTWYQGSPNEIPKKCRDTKKVLAQCLCAAYPRFLVRSPTPQTVDCFPAVTLVSTQFACGFIRAFHLLYHHNHGGWQNSSQQQVCNCGMYLSCLVCVLGTVTDKMTPRLRFQASCSVHAHSHPSTMCRQSRVSPRGLRHTRSS